MQNIEYIKNAKKYVDNMNAVCYHIVDQRERQEENPEGLDIHVKGKGNHPMQV